MLNYLIKQNATERAQEETAKKQGERKKWKRNTSYEICIEIPRSMTERDEESERSNCS